MDVDIDAVISEYVKKAGPHFSPEQVKEKLEKFLFDVTRMTVKAEPISGSSVELLVDFHDDGGQLKYYVNKSNKSYTMRSMLNTVIAHHKLSKVCICPDFLKTIETTIYDKIRTAINSVPKSDFAQKKLEYIAKEKEKKVTRLRNGVREQLKLAISQGLSYDDLKQILDEELVRFVQD